MAARAHGSRVFTTIGVAMLLLVGGHLHTPAAPDPGPVHITATPLSTPSATPTEPPTPDGPSAPAPNFGRLDSGIDLDRGVRPKPRPKRTVDVTFGGVTLEVSRRVDDLPHRDLQRYCDAVPKPGAVALGRLLMAQLPGSTSQGVVRACHLGPSSEHKEGRAFDWAVGSFEHAAVEAVIAELLAADDHGNEHALVRRMGIMYIVWDGRMWSAYEPEAGWQPYTGPDRHRTHVHFSMSWDGALGHTSMWQAAARDGWLRPWPRNWTTLRGLVPYTPPASPTATPTEPQSSPRPTASTSPTSPPATPSPTPSPTTTPSPTPTPQPTPTPTPTAEPTPTTQPTPTSEPTASPDPTPTGPTPTEPPSPTEATHTVG